jgi:hypothetical protein
MKCHAGGRVVFPELPVGPTRLTAQVEGDQRSLKLVVPTGTVTLAAETDE